MRNTISRFSLVAGLAIACSAAAFGAPRLRLDQTAVGPISIAQGANGTAGSVGAANTGDGSLNLRLSSSADWLVPTLGQPRDCTPFARLCTPVEFALRTSTLARGTYTGVVTLSDPAAIDAPQTITVVVNVGGGVPDRIDLTLPPTGAATQFRFETSSPLNAVAATQTGGSWLAVSAEGAGSFRFSYPYLVTAQHQTGQAEGTYQGSIVTTGSTVAGENRTVPVTLRITSQPIAQLSSERVTFRIAQGSARQTAGVAISNRGQGTLAVSGATATTASGGNWLTVTSAGNNLSVVADPGALAPGTYSGTVTVNSNASQASVQIPVELTIVAASAPVSYTRGLVNNATFDGGDVVAQGGLVALFGEQFTTGEPIQGTLPLPTDLRGVRVFVNDRQVPIYYLSYGQINFQIPFDAAPGDALVRVERDGQRGNTIQVRIARAAPRLLQFLGNRAIAVNTDQTFPIPITPGIASRPAREGDTLVFYALGLGPTTPAVASGAASPGDPLARNTGEYRVTFGSAGPFGGGYAEAQPFFVGLTPSYVGLYQVNVTIPAGVPKGPAVSVALEGDGGSSNRVTIAIE